LVVLFGHDGDVSRSAQERGVGRPWVDREADGVQQHLAEPQEIHRLRQQVQEGSQRPAELAKPLAKAVVLAPPTHQEFAGVGQAGGLSWPVGRTLLEVLRPGQAPSVAKLGRASKAAGDQAGRLGPVLDAGARERLRAAAAAALDVHDPVRMVVAPESLCWRTGRLSAAVSGDAWAQAFRQFPNLEPGAREGGKGLAKGVALVNAARGARPVADGGSRRSCSRLARRPRRLPQGGTAGVPSVDRSGHGPESVGGLSTARNV
jgi:hypothetical protein